MRDGGHAALLRLGANESAFGPSRLAVDAMAAELPHLSWYGDPESYELRSLLALKHGCAIEQISVGSGIDDLTGLAVRAFLSPGENVLTTRGTYPTFLYHARGFGGTVQSVAYRADGTVDVDAMIARARETEPAIVYVANPDNPSGTLLPPAEVLRLFEQLPERTLLFLDEAYADFVEDDELPPALISERFLRTRTFSKAYGMAGARVGYAICAERTVRAFQKIRLHYGVNRNAQIGAIASLRDVTFRTRAAEWVARGRQEYYHLARSLGVPYLESRANFVCFDLGSEQRATAVMNELLRRGVFVRKPNAPPLEGFVRVTVGTPEERAEFHDRFRASLEEFPQR